MRDRKEAYEIALAETMEAENFKDDFDQIWNLDDEIFYQIDSESNEDIKTQIHRLQKQLKMNKSDCNSFLQEKQFQKNQFFVVYWEWFSNFWLDRGRFLYLKTLPRGTRTKWSSILAKKLLCIVLLPFILKLPIYLQTAIYLQ